MGSRSLATSETKCGQPVSSSVSFLRMRQHRIFTEYTIISFIPKNLYEQFRRYVAISSTAAVIVLGGYPPC